MKKRSFLKYFAALGLGGSLLPSELKAFDFDALDWSREDIWDQLRAGYRLKPDYLNFENGY